MPGRRGVGGVLSSSRSSGGVKNGSSGGRCSTTGNEVTEEYERKEGGAPCGVPWPLEPAGWIPIVGILASRDGVLVAELPRERLPRNAANAVLGCRRKPPAATFESEDLRKGVSGRERSGFIT